MAIAIVYLDIAIQDLHSIYRYIARDLKKYAALEVKNVKQFINSLTNFPLRVSIFKLDLGRKYDRSFLVTISFLVRTENQISI